VANTPQVPAVIKAIAIVRLLNGKEDMGMGLMDIAESTGTSRSHCHAILQTLIASNWLEYDKGQRKYLLKSGVVADTSWGLRSQRVIATVRPLLVELSDRLQLSNWISQMLPDGTFITVDKVDGPGGLQLSIPLGKRFPHDVPTQRKLALAWLAPSEVNQWLADWDPVKYTAHTITDKRKFLLEVNRTAARGYATSIEEFEAGVMSVGLPIFDHVGGLRFCLVVPGIAKVMHTRHAQIATEMRRTMKSIHSTTGGRPPPSFPSS